MSVDGEAAGFGPPRSTLSQNTPLDDVPTQALLDELTRREAVGVKVENGRSLLWFDAEQVQP